MSPLDCRKFLDGGKKNEYEKWKAERLHKKCIEFFILGDSFDYWIVFWVDSQQTNWK
jgi:hypothetical protein